LLGLDRAALRRTRNRRLLHRSASVLPGPREHPRRDGGLPRQDLRPPVRREQFHKHQRKESRMRRISTCSTIAFILGVLVTSNSPMFADDHHGCSRNGVAGKWSYRLAGSLLINPDSDLYPNDVPVAGVGTFTLDRDGNVSGGGPYKSGNGLEQVSFSGTYTVESDCTGVLALDVVIDGDDI